MISKDTSATSGAWYVFSSSICIELDHAVARWIPFNLDNVPFRTHSLLIRAYCCVFVCQAKGGFKFHQVLVLKKIGIPIFSNLPKAVRKKSVPIHMAVHFFFLVNFQHSIQVADSRELPLMLFCKRLLRWTSLQKLVAI